LKVLIGIISKNRVAILPKAIQSALDQKINDKNILIFDDNSTDDTKNLKALFPQVEWYFSNEDKGYVYGRNKLMKETQAEYYCSLDDDSWFTAKEDLAIACNYLDTHLDVAAIAFDILSPDKPDKNDISEPVETNLYVGCGHVLRLSAIKITGYYIEFPGFYAGEERDLCIRFIDKGYKIVRLPGIHIWHDKTMVSRNKIKQCISNVCNDLSYAYIRFPVQKMLMAIPYKIFLHLRQNFGNGLLVSCIIGINKFFYFLLTFRLKRQPVSLSSFKKFQKLY
jgi:GT2 family glycosyltransferase